MAVLATPADELAGQLAAVKASRAEARRQRWRGSRLDRYRAELVALVELGASWRDLAAWLRQYKRMRVNPATVGRRLRVWKQEAAAAVSAGAG
jgi:hypothetical protein